MYDFLDICFDLDYIFIGFSFIRILYFLFYRKCYFSKKFKYNKCYFIILMEFMFKFSLLLIVNSIDFLK